MRASVLAVLTLVLTVFAAMPPAQAATSVSTGWKTAEPYPLVLPNGKCGPKFHLSGSTGGEVVGSSCVENTSANGFHFSQPVLVVQNTGTSTFNVDAVNLRTWKDGFETPYYTCAKRPLAAKTTLWCVGYSWSWGQPTNVASDATIRINPGQTNQINTFVHSGDMFTV